MPSNERGSRGSATSPQRGAAPCRLPPIARHSARVAVRPRNSIVKGPPPRSGKIRKRSSPGLEEVRAKARRGAQPQTGHAVLIAEEQGRLRLPEGSRACPPRRVVRPQVQQGKGERDKGPKLSFGASSFAPSLKHPFSQVLRPPAGRSAPVTVTPPRHSDGRGARRTGVQAARSGLPPGGPTER